MYLFSTRRRQGLSALKTLRKRGLLAGFLSLTLHHQPFSASLHVVVASSCLNHQRRACPLWSVSRQHFLALAPSCRSDRLCILQGGDGGATPPSHLYRLSPLFMPLRSAACRLQYSNPKAESSKFSFEILPSCFWQQERIYKVERVRVKVRVRGRHRRSESRPLPFLTSLSLPSIASDKNRMQSKNMCSDYIDPPPPPRFTSYEGDCNQGKWKALPFAFLSL